LKKKEKRRKGKKEKRKKEEKKKRRKEEKEEIEFQLRLSNSLLMQPCTTSTAQFINRLALYLLKILLVTPRNAEAVSITPSIASYRS
jgi:hypothetical protein